MNIQQYGDGPWGKLVPLNPDQEPEEFDDGLIMMEAQGEQRIEMKPNGDVWITNLSASYLRIDSSWLEPNQEKQLFGGERLAYCRESKEEKGSFDYVFCFTKSQSKNELKRDREDKSSASNHKPLEKLIKVDNSLQEAEITCSICLGILTRCTTLCPCGHNFCGHCLIHHLRNSPSCPLCKKQIGSVIKNSTLCNIIEAAAKNSPNSQRSSNEGIIPLQKDLDGNVCRNGSGVFIGSIINKRREGQGTLVFPNGQIFQCIWKNDLKEGEGVWILQDGMIINGLWLNDQLQPRVEIKFTNGDFYKGEIKDLELNGSKLLLKSHGVGIFKMSNGEEYKGDWIEGKRQGLGTMKFANGNIYKGEWKNNKREGNGILTLKNGDKFEGTWRNDFYNGIGKYTWANGSEYEGNWTDSRRDGNGTLKDLNKDIYKGEWQMSKRHGKGALILKDGDKIEGNWINDTLQPMVKIEYPNGDRYEGEIKTQTYQKHGKGVMFFKNGSQYDGHWWNNKETGQGKYSLENADRKYEEFWKEGIIHYSSVTFANGIKFQATWKEVKEVEEKQVRGRKKKRNCK